jgi:hypothetical protein
MLRHASAIPLSRPSRNVTGVDCQATRSVFLSRKDVCRGDKPLIILLVHNRYGSQLRAKVTQVSIICQMYRITYCKLGHLHSFLSQVNCEKIWRNFFSLTVSRQCNRLFLNLKNVVTNISCHGRLNFSKYHGFYFFECTC